MYELPRLQIPFQERQSVDLQKQGKTGNGKM